MVKRTTKRKAGQVPLQLRAKVNSANKLFSEFTGHNGECFSVEKPDMPNVALVVGYLDGVMYETIRDGKTEKYLHRFKKKSRPLLCSSSDGKQLIVLGGAYDFTDRGIVDKK
ncbi:MAG TPA: hypothetical protein VJ577_11400 [Burkholderiaceae bacterium]|nr:hypothetical protein [Burkholderiaceae bacterium]